MHIASFKKQLSANGIGPGANWFKVDFHVHIPASSDYEYRGADAFEKLGSALTASGRKMAVVLKHQEFPSKAELESLQQHCPQTVLIPGAELNVFVDALSKKIGKDYFFHCILAVDPAAEQEYGYVLHKAKEEFTYTPGDYPSGFHSSILDLGRFFRDEQALFIPAHLHQSKRPEESRSIDDLYEDEAFLGFVKEGAFDALEVRQLKTAEFFDGSKTTKDNLPIPRMVCVASSDAHHHEPLSRARATWISMENATFDELRAGLHFPHRVSLEEPVAKHPRVLGVHIYGSFIKDAWFRLSDGLNALIGSKGSGKTAVLECMRFVLNTPVPPERAEQVKRHLAHILGSGGYVECLLVDEQGDELLITRRADAPDRITTLDSNGQSQVHSAATRLAFPVSILGWHEIEAVADKAAARIQLIDSVGDQTQVLSDYKAIEEHIEACRDRLPLLQREVRKLDSSLKQLWDLQRKRSTLTRLEQTDLSALQQQYEWFLLSEQKLTGLKDAAARRAVALPGIIASALTIDIQPSPATESIASAAGALDTVSGAVKHLADTEGQTTTSLQAGLHTIQQAAEGAAAALSQAFAVFRDSVYTPKVNALPQEDREILAKQIQILEETKKLPLVERECQQILVAVRSEAKELARYCTSICNLRDEIVRAREDVVKRLNSDLVGVRLHFKRSINQDARIRFQQTYGSEGANVVGYLGGFGKAETYQNLYVLFERLEHLDITQEKWHVKDTTWDVKLVDFLRVIDDDDVEITLEVGLAGYVPIQNLSAGQRCVAVFPLLLRNSRGPLVIDQPEDNLDNRYIADVIAPDLLRRKRSQQFLVTSHNANLVVLTDAELIVHVDSNGAVSTSPVAGFLSCSTSKVKAAVLDVLDGGATALLARQNKYGLNAR